MKVGSGAAAVELKQRGKDERMKEEKMADSLSLTLYTFQAINGEKLSLSLFGLFPVSFCGFGSGVTCDCPWTPANTNSCYLRTFSLSKNTSEICIRALFAHQHVLMDAKCCAAWRTLDTF